MFSGKTEELIRRLKRVMYGKQRLQVFKPFNMDNSLVVLLFFLNLVWSAISPRLSLIISHIRTPILAGVLHQPKP